MNTEKDPSSGPEHDGTNVIPQKIEKIEIPTVGLRMAAMLLDHFSMTFLLTVSGFLVILPLIFFTEKKTHTPFAIAEGWTVMVIFSLLFSAYFNKDIFNGRSVAKRALKLQVVSNKDWQPASPVQCFLRNLTIIAWPVEVIFTLFSPARRIGDYIAGTRVAFYNTGQEKKKNSLANFIAAIVLGWALIGLLIALTFFSTNIFPKIKHTPTAMDQIDAMVKSDGVKTVYNKEESGGIKHGYVSIEIKEPVIPSGKLSNPDLISSYVALVMKKELKRKNDSVYSKLYVRLVINGIQKEYEYPVVY
jgi:uncharacterized RDD family membrane protein YckC